MVEANPSTAGDGIERRIQYATFRTDKEPSPGYSAELISNRVPKEFYDNLEGQRNSYSDYDTLLKLFKRNVAALPNEKFLGTRESLPAVNGKPQFGEYIWKSNADVNKICENLSRGLMEMGLITETEGEGRQWKFCGIWMKNRWEWTASLLSCMHFSITAVGFYDAMSVEQVDFILN